LSKKEMTIEQVPVQQVSEGVKKHVAKPDDAAYHKVVIVYR
jgi:hypothetical protein